VDELIFIGQTGGPFNFQPAPVSHSTQTLKALYARDVGHLKPGKVYISRRNSGKRLILNEADVIRVVQKYDYDVVRTEDMTIEEQIKLFSRTTDLISIHGAGLSNMVFMPEGSRIIEIRHRDDNPMLTCFFTLAHTFNHTYYYSFGDEKGDSLPSEVRPEDKSIHADLTMLEQVLSSIA
jgi:capsular polysaccharide biosynthesis protein